MASASLISFTAFGTRRKPTHVQPSRDGKSVLVHHRPGEKKLESITVWKGTPQLEPLRQHVPGQRDFDGGCISPDGKLGSIGLNPGNRAYVYELDSGRVVLDQKTQGNVYGHLFSPDGRYYYAFTSNGWRYGWELATQQKLWQPRQEPGLIRPAAISPDGQLLLAGHNDGHIRVYEAASGTLVKTLDHPGEVKTLRFAPDHSGRFLSGSTDGVAHIWDVFTGRKLQSFRGHTHTIIASAWSPDSRLVATASYDTTARVWDVASGQMQGAPMNHFAWLSHLEFNPKGSTLATACRDGTARLWDVKTTRPLSPPLPQGYTCETVRFTADGATFLVRDHEGFRFWDAQSAIPVSIHYFEPVSGGMGMDSANWRSLMTPDGTRIYLSYSINAGTLWHVRHTRAPAPPWFDELLETLCLASLNEEISNGLPLAENIIQLREQLRKCAPDDFHATWAKRVLGMNETP